MLDMEGQIISALPEFARDRAIPLRLYRGLVLTRTFDA
jgi:hypothetical protein